MNIEAKADDRLIARWIRPARAYPGDPDARIVDTGIPVWALVGNFKASHGDLEATATDYDLPPEAAAAAMAYYRLHQDVIDARLAANIVEAV